VTRLQNLIQRAAHYADVISLNPKDARYLANHLRRFRWFDINTHRDVIPYIGYAFGAAILPDPNVPRGTTGTPYISEPVKTLLRRGVNDEALAHYKSIALKHAIALGLAQPTRPGGFYRTTPKGCHAIQTYPDLYARLIENDPTV
jgi:hypothetical protein